MVALPIICHIIIILATINITGRSDAEFIVYIILKVTKSKNEKMKTLQIPEFKNYEEEAAFWDNLDTSDFMEDDGEWFRFDTPHKRAIRVAILPETALLSEAALAEDWNRSEEDAAWSHLQQGQLS